MEKKNKVNKQCNTSIGNQMLIYSKKYFVKNKIHQQKGYITIYHHKQTQGKLVIKSTHVKQNYSIQKHFCLMQFLS